MFIVKISFKVHNKHLRNVGVSSFFPDIFEQYLQNAVWALTQIRQNLMRFKAEVVDLFSIDIRTKTSKF